MILQRTFECLDEKCFPSMFKYLVRQDIEYVNPIWSPCLMKHITALVIKLITGYVDLNVKNV